MRLNITARQRRIAITVVLVGAAAFVFRSEVLAFIIEPIGWLLWAGWRLLASVDQGLCWASVVVISALLMLRLIPARMGPVEPPTSTRDSQWGSAARLDYWQELSRRSARSRQGREAFQASLAALTLAVADSTRLQPPRPASPAGHGLLALVTRLQAGGRRRAQLRAAEQQLAWMESAMEIKHERSAE
ncbi:MAG: hypothetical protein ACM3QS_11940 [Bacteroidota bacterium]